jgi:hypothetical protein
MKAIPADLRPGDGLLYEPWEAFGWFIAIKTWHEVSHVEVYVGDGVTVAARVDTTPAVRMRRLTLADYEHIRYVVRPRAAFDLERALAEFHRRWEGQGYDYLGLARFGWMRPLLPSPDDRQFCSELLTRFYRAGGFDPFAGEPADAIAPFMPLVSPAFEKWGVDHGEIVAAVDSIGSDSLGT